MKMIKKNKESQEYRERKEMIKLDRETAKIKHKMRMQELEYNRESDRLHHERDLERGRIKTAEIRKSMERKDRMIRGVPYE